METMTHKHGTPGSTYLLFAETENIKHGWYKISVFNTPVVAHRCFAKIKFADTGPQANLINAD